LRHEHYLEIEGKAYDARLMRRLLGYLVPYRGAVAGVFVLLTVVALLGLVGPYLIKIAIDSHIQKGITEGLGLLAGLYLMVLLGEFSLKIIQIYLMQWIGQNIMKDLRQDIFCRLQSLSIDFFHKNPVGGMVSRVIGDINVLNEMFSAGIVTVFGDILVLGGIMAAMLLMHWRLALVVFVIIPVIFGITYLFRKHIRESFRDVRRTITNINAYLKEHIQGIAVTQLFIRQEINLERFKQLNAEHLDAYLKTIFYYAVFFPAIEVVSSVALALIIWYGGGNVFQGTLSFGVLVAFIEYTQRFFRPINDLSEKYNIMQSAMAASERIFKLMDTTPKIRDPESPQHLSGFRQSITFEHVWFSYTQETPVLKDIHFTVQKGERVAVVGLTGVGKTSLIQLLNRFYDVNRGRILIDGIDIRDVTQKNLRSHLALVLQDPFIFSGTITENIRLGREDISMEQVQWAAKTVCAHPFIEKLENGYETILREQGVGLSAGQRQLLAFARALAFDRDILLLDEATSSIDSETEHLIQEGLEHLMQNRTSIVIAHRLSTIRQADRIIVLDQGEIKEMGNHQQLMEKAGLYSKLYQLQFQEEPTPL
jgi:ATP-binding cassette subfamily B protein